MKNNPTKTRKNLIHPKLYSLVLTAFYDEHGQATDSEPHLSKSPCDCCGDRKAGDRYECNAVVNDKGTHPLCVPSINACPDCVQVWA